MRLIMTVGTMGLRMMHVDVLLQEQESLKTVAVTMRRYVRL